MKPEVDQRKSPRPIALARLRHDGFGPGGRPVSRKGDSQVVASRIGEPIAAGCLTRRSTRDCPC